VMYNLYRTPTLTGQKVNLDSVFVSLENT
jgi:hypothetical protein